MESWTYTVDRTATRVAYSELAKGGSDTCNCAYCRNFRVARDLVLPPAFLAFLDDLGIDPTKDAEVFQYNREEGGLHCYGGWYHFIGHLAVEGEPLSVEFGPHFSASLRRADAAKALAVEASELVQIDFLAAAVPWVLDEEDPG